jgi:hypothetical protein
VANKRLRGHPKHHPKQSNITRARYKPDNPIYIPPTVNTTGHPLCHNGLSIFGRFHGGVAERPKVRDCESRGLPGPEGSNPSTSARPKKQKGGTRAANSGPSDFCVRYTTPSRVDYLVTR